MNTISIEQLPDLFAQVASVFTENKDLLCEMDANMGDGDLGLTMQKGFSAFPDLIRDNSSEGDIGKILFKSGMKMASIVPSTMGTLMSSGIMEGGKSLKGLTKMSGKDMAKFLEGFAAGVQKRGKCEPGDRTLLDAMGPAAAEALAKAESGCDIGEVLLAACTGAERGVEATKDMMPKFGKAAVFSAKAKGIPDQGAVAGKLFVTGLSRYFEKG